MAFFSRLFGALTNPTDQWQPAWRAIVGCARQAEWYADLGVSDTKAGRFDMVTLVLALVILRMERSADLAPHTARITEIFVTDMEGQLRQEGIGDPTVGKQIGKMMAALGGRIGALRGVFDEDHAAWHPALMDVLKRNVTFNATHDLAAMAHRIIAMANRIAAADDDALRQGAFA